MKDLMPAPSLMSFRKEVDRFLDRIREGEMFDLPTSADWIPNMDFTEKSELFLVKLEVPGIEPKDIEILFQNGLLTVRGEKRYEVEEKDARTYRMERSFGTFVRNLRLPAPVDEKHIEATFKNGVLTIQLPKTAEARSHAIPIKNG